MLLHIQKKNAKNNIFLFSFKITACIHIINRTYMCGMSNNLHSAIFIKDNRVWAYVLLDTVRKLVSNTLKSFNIFKNITFKQRQQQLNCYCEKMKCIFGIRCVINGFFYRFRSINKHSPKQVLAPYIRHTCFTKPHTSGWTCLCTYFPIYISEE